MLNEARLAKEIKAMLDDVVPGAMEQAWLETFPGNSEAGRELAKKFGETFNKLTSPHISQRLAAAIDYYVRNADIYGTLITTGSPVLHTCAIESPFPLTNGKVPNTLGLK